MQKLSQQEVLYHSRPAPKAQPAMIDPFPPGVRWGLWLGLGVRAFLGLLFGFLLFQRLTNLRMGNVILYDPRLLSMSFGFLLEVQLGYCLVSSLPIHTVTVKKGIE